MKRPLAAMWARQAGVVLAAVAAVGCSSPAGRAKEHSAVFDTFSEDVQEEVRQGKIALGYTEQMVHIAKGPPARKYERRTTSGTTLVWSYTDVEIDTERQRVQGRIHFTDTLGKQRTASDTVWADIQHKREFEVLRVEFDKGRVASIEHLKR